MAKNVRDVLDVVKQAEIPFVAFTTNALLFDEEIVRKIIEAGIMKIYVSFDGATEATFASIRGGASMQKVIEKVKLFNQIKESLSVTSPKIEVHITLMRSNIEEESLSNHKDLYDTCIAGARRRARELGVEFEVPAMFSEIARSTRRVLGVESVFFHGSPP